MTFSRAPSACSSAKTIWTGSDDGVAFITRDGGATWKNITPPGLGDFNRISLIEATSSLSNVTAVTEREGSHGRSILTKRVYRYAIMHDKFIVVDGQTVEEGSFNYTAAAEAKNAENVVVLRDASVAQRYGQEWDRLWAESEI